MKKLSVYVLVFLLVLTLIFVYLYYKINLKPPELSNKELFIKHEKSIIQKNIHYYGKNWIFEQEPNIWVMYISGSGYELGHNNGILSEQLNKKQEQFFVEEINQKVPSKFYQFFLKLLIGWFNKDIDQHIPLEYQKEILGISNFSSNEYNYIGSAYQRLINYHAAHDIGHALQNMNLVACTALGVWNEHSVDSSIIIGRNFDFFVGENFSKNKLISLVKPKTGYSFLSISWGGMIGIVSGMNQKGLSVTLNADKSDVPNETGTPVSIIGREIIQYSSTIQQAFEIAKKRKSFVSESFLIGSAEDNQVAIIEKTPNKTSIYFPKKNNIICTNHFQSEGLISDPLNTENISDSTSLYRYQRVEELMRSYKKLDEEKIISILRDRFGKNNALLGNGNPKCINQLIAHHSIVFNNTKKQVWISTGPYQLGKYLFYNLDSIFNKPYPTSIESNKYVQSDTFLFSKEFLDYQEFKNCSIRIKKLTKNTNNQPQLSKSEIDKYIGLNPNYYIAYQTIGDYYFQQEDLKNALKYYQLASKKDLPSEAERKSLKERINKSTLN